MGSVKHGDLNRFGLQSGSDLKCLLRVMFTCVSAEITKQNKQADKQPTLI